MRATRCGRRPTARRGRAPKVPLLGRRVRTVAARLGRSARNAEEILRLGTDVRQRIKIHLIDDVGEAFELALLPAEESRQSRIRSFRRRAASRAKKATQRRSKRRPGEGETT